MTIEEEKQANPNNEDLKGVYRYTLTVTFEKELSEKELRNAYKNLLGIEKFDGFSNFHSLDDEDHTSFFVVSSKDNVLTLEVNSDDFTLTLKNPFQDEYEKFDFSYEALAALVAEVRLKAPSLFLAVGNVELLRENFIFSNTKAPVVSKKIFNSAFFDEGSYGFTARYMTHIDDVAIKNGGHIHGFFSVYNAYISEARQEVLMDRIKGLDSYITALKYTYGGDELISEEDLDIFLRNYLKELERESSVFLSKLGLD